jgi:predicted ArsR family transcriptional regulator
MVNQTGSPPTLTALACPYPELAERDRSVCAMERMLFADLLGRDVKLAGCRLDGAACCTFEVPDA